MGGSEGGGRERGEEGQRKRDRKGDGEEADSERESVFRSSAHKKKKAVVFSFLFLILWKIRDPFFQEYFFQVRISWEGVSNGSKRSLSHFIVCSFSKE